MCMQGQVKLLSSNNKWHQIFDSKVKQAEHDRLHSNQTITLSGKDHFLITYF